MGTSNPVNSWIFLFIYTSMRITLLHTNPFHQEIDDLILDIDRIWDAICLDGWRHKTKRLNANVFGIRDCMLDMIRTRTGMWRNAYIIGGYPLRSDRDRLCDMLRATPIYIESTLDECLARAETERPDDWKEYIIRWFENYVE